MPKRCMQSTYTLWMEFRNVWHDTVEKRRTLNGKADLGTFKIGLDSLFMQYINIYITISIPLMQHVESEGWSRVCLRLFWALFITIVFSVYLFEKAKLFHSSETKIFSFNSTAHKYISYTYYTYIIRCERRSPRA